MKLAPLIAMLLILPLASSYENYADPVSGFTMPSSVSFASGESQKGLSVSVTDSAVYRTGHYSFGDGSWHAFNFSQQGTNGWVLGTATKDLAVPAGSSTDNYVITYTCTKNGSTWNCHDNKWQIRQFGTSIQTQTHSTILLTARGDSALGIAPHLIVSADGVVVGETNVASSTATYSYTADGDVSSVTLAFDNDYYDEAAGADRNIYVTAMSINGVSVSLPGCTYSGGVWYNSYAIFGGDGQMTCSVGGSACVPETRSVTCGSWVCGTRTNNCDQTVACGTCTTGSCSSGVCVTSPPPEMTTIIVNARGANWGTTDTTYAHFWFRVNGREWGNTYTTNSYQDYTFIVPIPQSAVSIVELELDNVNVWDGSGGARNLLVRSITVDGTALDLPSCDNENGIWYDNDHIVFQLDGEMSCATGFSCTADCSLLMCGESRNDCGSCGDCTAGRCLAGYCVTGPGRLHVSGNHLVDEQGTAHVLKGFNYVEQGSISNEGEFLQDRGDRVELDFAAMEEWNVDAIRLLISPFSQDYFAQDHEGYMDKYLDREIALAAKHDMYAIIDYHDFFDTDPDTHDRMMDFWTTMAQRYAGYEHVIYELFNEPYQGTWSNIKGMHEEAIDIIRSYDPDALVIASGLEWGYDIHYILTDPVQRPNVAYGTHPYPGKVSFCHGDVSCMRSSWDGKFGDASEVYPVIVTEVGWEPDGSGREWDDSTAEFGVPFFAYLNEKGVGYSIMSFTTGYFMHLLETLEPDYIPSPAGQFIKDDLAKG